MAEKDKSIRQPTNRRMPGPNKPLYMAGAKRSVAVLKELGYDPITALVEQYRALQEELKYHESVRDGTVVPLTATGRIRAYNPETHLRVYELMITVGDKLLRYGYGRVPEMNVLETNDPKTLVVQMTGTNEQWKINSLPPVNYIDVDGEGNPIEDQENVD